MRKSLLAVILLISGAISQQLYSQNVTCNANSLISNSCIWKGNQYAAFTSLITFDEVFYCAFREADSHVDLSGVNTGHIVVLRSNDGEIWEKYRIIYCIGYDLRDPQFFIDSERHLNLLAEKVRYANNEAVVRESCYLDLMDNNNRIDLRPINFDNDIKWNWLWNVNAVNDTLYGFTYAPYFALYKSTDGRRFRYVSTPKLENEPTEGAIIDLDEKTLLAVVRQNGFAAIGKSYDNGKAWNWKQSIHSLDCPKLIHFKHKIILAGRNVDKKPHTSIYEYNKDTEDFEVIFDLPDNGDCSYPGLIENDGYIYISYYQSRNKTHSDIYFAKLELIK